MAITRVVTINRKEVVVVELGKGLFRKGGSVLMPGKFGTDDGPKDENSDKAELLKKEGVKALAAVFKQFEFDSRWRLVIAAHANDATGGVKENFDLSAVRAKGVLHLLKGESALWAGLCHKNHQVEDAQRILKYFHVCHEDWKCDPKAVNGTWSDDVFKATEKLAEAYNASHAAAQIPVGVLDKLKTDPKKLWSVEIWKAVFDLYTEDMCVALKINPPDPMKLRRKAIKFGKETAETVACGESFPLNEADSKYKAAKERKVDILFFHEKEFPGVDPNRSPFLCPAAGAATHTWRQCPIFREKSLRTTYVDPEKDLNSIAYHLVFSYYSVVLDGIRRVPEGLDVHVCHYETPGIPASKKPIPARVSFYEGVYTSIVADENARTNLHFEFEAKDPADATKQMWIHTKDTSTRGVLVTETRAEIAKLTVPDKVAKRITFYDLPKEWSSENYWTRYMGDDGKWKANRFEEVMKMEKKLKPYAPKDKTTTVDKPLIFSLDDIVLVDKGGDQNINDIPPKLNKARDKDDTDAAKDLSANSRISILHVKNQDLVLYNPIDASAPYFSKNPFQENLITDVPPQTRMVIFANDFYGVYDKRAGQVGWPCDFAKKHVKGCRAAKLEDKDNHVGMTVQNTPGGAGTRYYARACGNFELHYVHNGCLITSPADFKVRSFLIVYWNGVFESEQVPAPAPAPAGWDNHVISANDVITFRTAGLMNSEKRWEKKGYTIEPRTPSADGRGKVQIKPVFFFEAKTNTLGGKPKCTVKVYNNIFKPGMMGIDISRIYYKYYEDFNYLLLNPSAFTDIDGKSFKTLVVAHELGHAMGKMDDYAYHKGEFPGGTDGPFNQWYLGMPYDIDKGSMMKTNRAPRLKQMWYFVNRLNDAAADNAELKGLLNGTTYQAVHRFTRGGNAKKLQYFLSSAPNDYRDIHKPFKPDPRALAATSSVPAPPVAACAGTGKVDLFLYKLAEDEHAWNVEIGGAVQNFAFNGILVVFVKLGFKFNPFTDTSVIPHVVHAWDAVGEPTKEAWMADVKAEIVGLNNRFYFESTNAGSDFKRTYVSFFPICLDNPASGPHYTIEVTLNGTSTVSPRVAGATTLNVGSSVSPLWIARYVLGHDPDPAGTASNAPILPAPGAITKNDLLFLRDWIRAQLADATINFK
jgi:hypothetical protein